MFCFCGTTISPGFHQETSTQIKSPPSKKYKNIHSIFDLFENILLYYSVT
jgi:hypothetical protein